MPGALRDDSVEHSGLSDSELTLLLDYERRFLGDKQVAEKLYCDRCYAANRPDGCRVQVAQNGLTGVVRIECRCRVRERKGSAS